LWLRCVNYNDTNDMQLLAGSVANRKEGLDQLKLALDWDRIDVAKNILTADDDATHWKVRFLVMSLCIYQRLRRNVNVSYRFVLLVKLFCIKGVSLIDWGSTGKLPVSNVGRVAKAYCNIKIIFKN